MTCQSLINYLHKEEEMSQDKAKLHENLGESLSLDSA